MHDLRKINNNFISSGNIKIKLQKNNKPFAITHAEFFKKYFPWLKKTHLVWVMIQIINGLEMSLAKQYFDDWLVSIKQQDRNFSRTEKRDSNHSMHVKGFSITRSNEINLQRQVR